MLLVLKDDTVPFQPMPRLFLLVFVLMVRTDRIKRLAQIHGEVNTIP